tara:strand:- start:737 stop:982 length:246 start_codon:yes stop_codon:yes gene_type:complete
VVFAPEDVVILSGRKQKPGNQCRQGAGARFRNENKLSDALKHGNSEEGKVRTFQIRLEVTGKPYRVLLESASEFNFCLQRL